MRIERRLDLRDELVERAHQFADLAGADSRPGCGARSPPSPRSPPPCPSPAGAAQAPAPRTRYASPFATIRKAMPPPMRTTRITVERRVGRLERTRDEQPLGRAGQCPRYSTRTRSPFDVSCVSKDGGLRVGAPFRRDRQRRRRDSRARDDRLPVCRGSRRKRRAPRSRRARTGPPGCAPGVDLFSETMRSARARQRVVDRGVEAARDPGSRRTMPNMAIRTAKSRL